jgi:hypothetical protein
LREGVPSEPEGRLPQQRTHAGEPASDPRGETRYDRGAPHASSKQGRSLTLSAYCWVVTVIFAYTLLVNIAQRPDGLIIATIFILVIIVIGAISRCLRATELRVAGLAFEDEESATLWRSISKKEVHLAPYTPDDSAQRIAVAEKIRKHYRVQGPFAFINVKLLDNRSEFLAPLRAKVQRDCDNYVIYVTGAVATANALAYMTEKLKPISVFLELSQRNVTTQAIRFLLLGEGEVGLLVYNILLRFWASTPEDEERPNLYLMSSAQDAT